MFTLGKKHCFRDQVTYNYVVKKCIWKIHYAFLVLLY